MRNCSQVSKDDMQFEFDMAAEGCGTVGVLPEGRKCVGANPHGNSGSLLSLLDCNTPMTNSLYFCLPRSALVQMRAAALLSGPSTQERKQPDTAESKFVKAGAPGNLLHWRARPEMCVGVVHDQPGSGTGSGDSLQLWDCGNCTDHFLLPPDGKPGMIRWAQHPDLCLDSPADPSDPTVLQLWLCNVTPAEHKNFTPGLGAGGDGTIRLTQSNTSCISVPEGESDSGAHLIMRTCDSSDQNFHFFFVHEVQTTTRPTIGEQRTDSNGMLAVGSNAREEVEISANATVTTWVTLVCIACSVALFLFLCCLTCASMR